MKGRGTLRIPTGNWTLESPWGNCFSPICLVPQVALVRTRRPPKCKKKVVLKMLQLLKFLFHGGDGTSSGSQVPWSR